VITDTRVLINTIHKSYPVVQFFKDRYFPDGRSFYSSKALIEVKKKGRKIAPYVVPVVGGIKMESEGYRTEEVKAPYIAPKMTITPEDLEKKAFGESPESERSPEDRENEVEAEHMDDLRKSILRRQEQMCGEILTTGQLLMDHYASAEDAANKKNANQMYLQFYDKEFGNKYNLPSNFKEMSAKEKLIEIYKMVAVLKRRGVRATDMVMSADVSMLFMTDEEFLEYYNKRDVQTGTIKQEELPEGVTYNGNINVSGVVLNMFTYDEQYEDLDGELVSIIPSGSILLLEPNMGETVYAQVTFATKDNSFESHADRIIPRVVTSEENNVMEVQTFSRPVPYVFDIDGWLYANISDTDLQVESLEDGTAVGSEERLSEDEINAMTRKADVIEYAESIGLTGLSDSETLTDLKAKVIDYQSEE
jgi:hypothetical protein